MTLNSKQKAFAREYIKDYNGTQAAIRAGYSKKSAAVQASRMLKQAAVIDEIKKFQAEYIKKSCITKDRVIAELLSLLEKCMTEVPVKEWDYDEHAFVETGVYQFDSRGAIKAIELLGKHLGMFDKSSVHKADSEDDGFIDALNQKAGELNWE